MSAVISYCYVNIAVVSVVVVVVVVVVVIATPRVARAGQRRGSVPFSFQKI